MKKLSLGSKIILCFTAMFVLLFATTMPIRYYIVSKNLYENARILLQSETERVAEMVISRDYKIDPKNDLQLIGADTYVAVYSKDNVLLSGKLPQGFTSSAIPKFGGIYSDESDNQKWIVYDYSLLRDGDNIGWLRAVKPLHPVSETLGFLKASIIKIIPIFTIIIIIGWIVIQKTLFPVKKITKTVGQIGHEDLATRINFNGPRDELGVLAETFDKMLERLEDSFGREKRFSSDVSHELRTPVTAIIVNAEEALDGEKTTEDYKENLNVILLEAKKMNTLISQLLMMARSIDGKYMQELETIGLSVLTRAIVDEVSERESHPDVTVTADVEDGIFMHIDQTMYMRLLYNLIDNATKYNVPGGWIKVSLRKSENDIFLSVADGGIGISEENLPKIWNRFYKADQSTINSSPGLGLSIVKWIAEQFGGTVNVKSELGKGSVFEVMFPISNMQ